MKKNIGVPKKQKYFYKRLEFNQRNILILLKDKGLAKKRQRF